MRRKAFEKIPRRVYLNRECKDEFPFDLSGPQVKVHLIAVTRGIGEHAKNYFDKHGGGSRGTLVSMYGLNEKQINDSPFTINDLDPERTFVHVLDESGLDLLLTELSTPLDFIKYLECKESAIRSGSLGCAMGEEELLGYYLLNEAKYGFGSIPNLTGHKYAVAEHQWRMFRDSIPYALHYARRKKSEYWNSILTRFSDCIIEGDVGEGKNLPLLNHAQVLHSLASENIYSRAILSENLSEKYETVPVNARSARIVPSACHDKNIYTRFLSVG